MMGKVFTKKYSVKRKTNERLNIDKQYLILTFYFLNIPVFRKIEDEEDVPSWASIEMGCLGSSAWRSKFKQYINK